MVDLKTAISYLYEDESLTGELDDAEAQTLLKWAEGRVGSLVDQFPDDEAYDSAFTPLRAMLKRVNKVVGQRNDMAPDEMVEMLGKIAETARSMGGQVDDAQVQSAAAGLAALPAADALQQLLTWASPAVPAEQPITDVQPPAPAADVTASTGEPPAAQDSPPSDAWPLSNVWPPSNDDWMPSTD